MWQIVENATRMHASFLAKWVYIVRPHLFSDPTIRLNGTADASARIRHGSSEHSSLKKHFSAFKAVEYQPELIPVSSRFSINFFAIQARHFYKLLDSGYDDEVDLTMYLPSHGIMRNYMYSNFFVVHLAFGPQYQFDMNVTALLEAYDLLFEVYCNDEKILK